MSLVVTIGTFSFVFLFILFFLLVVKVNRLYETVHDVNNIVNGCGYRTSLKGSIGEIMSNGVANKESIELILKGLPNLYKDDLDLVQKVDYPKSTGRFLTTNNIISSSIVVVFTGSGINSYPVPLDKTLRRANEIRDIQEKCCPKKKGKK